MSATPIPHPQPPITNNHRTTTRATGPRTDSGKQRSSLNALRHGLTAACAVLPTETQLTQGLHYQRLSRQFQKAVDHLREIQSERRREQEREIKCPAALLELHKRKGIPYDPAQDGFVFSRDQIEAHTQRLDAPQRIAPHRTCPFPDAAARPCRQRLSLNRLSLNRLFQNRLFLNRLFLNRDRKGALARAHLIAPGQARPGDN